MDSRLRGNDKMLDGFNKNPRMQQLLEGFGPVAHRMLSCRVYFGKSLVHAVGDEDGIIAEAMIAARRKGERAMHFAFEHPALARGQRDAKSADEFRGAGAEPFVAQLVMDAGHGDAEVLGRSRPARRIDSRRAAQRIDAKTGIV